MPRGRPGRFRRYCLRDPREPRARLYWGWQFSAAIQLPPTVRLRQPCHRAMRHARSAPRHARPRLVDTLLHHKNRPLASLSLRCASISWPARAQSASRTIGDRTRRERPALLHISRNAVRIPSAHYSPLLRSGLSFHDGNPACSSGVMTQLRRDRLRLCDTSHKIILQLDDGRRLDLVERWIPEDMGRYERRTATRWSPRGGAGPPS